MTRAITKLFLALMCLPVLAKAQTNPTAQTLTVPYTQNFGTANFSTAPAGMAMWTVATVPTTQATAESSTTNGNQGITAAAPASGGSGGAYGHATSSNARLTILQSGSSASQPVLALNTTGATSVSVSYDLSLTIANARDIGVVLQYRVGTTGGFTTVSGSAVAYNATSTNGGDADGPTDLDNYSFPLPAPALNQSVVQLRWANWRGAQAGSSSGIGFDNIVVTAATSCVAPTTQASAVIIGSPTASSLPVSWTSGDGGNRVVIANTANSFTAPADGTSPTASAAYNTVAGGEQVVYNGSGSSVLVTGLNASTTYYFRVYEYNCTGSSTVYNTSTATGNPASGTTAAAPAPCVAPNVAGAITFGTATTTSLPGSFTASSGGASGYLVFVSQNSSAPAISNGTTYTSANAPAGYTFLQDGIGLSFTANGLTASTTYYVYVFSYNNTGCTGGPAYAAATSASGATAAAPAAGLQVTSADVPVVVNFDATAAGSNTGSFSGNVNTTGNTGTLNSNAWSFDENLATGPAVFGGIVSGGAPVNAGGTTGAGIFALQVVNNSTANIALGFQPTGAVYTPGNATLRVQNQTGSAVTAANIGYIVYYVNDETRGNAFNFEYSTDNSTYTQVSALDLTSPAASGVTAATGNYRTVRLSGLSVPAGGYLYLRWTLDDAGIATGSRDEFGLDDISVTFNPVATSPGLSGGTYQSVVVSGPATTAGAVTVSGSLTMNSGVLTTTTANPLTLGAAATVTGGSDASYVSGPVSKTGTAAFTFPVGKSGQYRPVSIASLSGSDTYTAEYFQALPPNGGTQAVGSSGMNRVSFREYWDVSRTGSSTANLTLTWNANSQVSVPADIVVAHYNGTTWDNLGGTGTGTAASGSVTATNVSVFSPFTLGSLTAVNPLPIRLLSFAGRQEKSAVSLEWTSTCEAGMKQFVVERAEGSGQFESIGDLAARNGGCSGTARYTFDDRNLAAGTSYQYRLRMVEENGKESLSATLRFSTEASGGALRILSNPVAGSLELSGTATGDLVSVTDMSGRVLLQWTAVAGGRYDVSSLSPGTYLLRAVQGDRATTVRFFKQ